MIKILHICAALNDGGVERMIINYMSAMDRNKVCFDFVVHSAKIGMLEATAKSMGATVYHVPAKTRNPLRYMKMLDEILRKGHYQGVHCHQGYKSMYPLWIAKRRAIPVRIAHAHNAQIPLNSVGLLLKRFESWCTGRLATHLLACSESAGQDMWFHKPYICIPDAIEFKKYAFSVDKRNKMREQLQLQDCKVVGCVGRMVQQKNHKRLIDIVKCLQKEDPDIALVLVGSGPLEGEIRQYASDRELRNVIFAGSCSNVEDYLCAFDVFLLPTLFEGFGMVLLEAQVNGLETITSDVVPSEVMVTDFIHTVSLEQGDEVWCQEISKALCGRRGELQMTGELKNFDLETQVEQLIRIYK